MTVQNISPMVDSNKPQALEQNLILLRVIWFSMTVVQIMLVAMSKLLNIPEDHRQVELSMLAVGAGFIGLLSVAIFLIRRRFPDSNLLIVLVLCLALNGLITVSGFAGVLIYTRSVYTILPYAAVGIVLNIIMFPRISARADL